MIKENETIFKFAGLCTYGFCKELDNSYSFDWKLLETYQDDEDYIILKEKITNFYNELNKNDKYWLPMDIEKEIYFSV